MKNWILRHPILAIMIIGLAGLVPVLADVAFQWRDVATLYGPTSAMYDICWQSQTSAPIQTVQLRRTHIETGTQETTPKYDRSLWRPVGDRYCLQELKLPKTGHFAYEIKACYPLGSTEVCSAWLSSLDAAVGKVNSQPRAWWIYGHMPTLGQPVPLDTSPILESGKIITAQATKEEK